jgi:hypothetical protein
MYVRVLIYMERIAAVYDPETQGTEAGARFVILDRCYIYQNDGRLFIYVVRESL